MEIWKLIDWKLCKHPKETTVVWVSNQGRVWSDSFREESEFPIPHYPRKPRHGFRQDDGYAGAVPRGYSLHRIVMVMFSEPDPNPDRTWINHKNQNKMDARLENLEWVTPKENGRHATWNRHNPDNKVLSAHELTEKMWYDRFPNSRMKW